MRGGLRAKQGRLRVRDVFVAITLNFVLFGALSGDAVSALRCRQCTPGVQERTSGKRARPRESKLEQYWLYLADLAHGNMGRSLRTEEPVRSVLWEPLKNTVPMVALGTFFAILFGIATGVVAAWRRGTAADKGALWGGLGFYSMPPQWLGLADRAATSQAGLGYRPPGSRIRRSASSTHPGAIEVVVDRLEHMILPALTLGLVVFGEYTLIVRSAMLETLGEDYILTSREGPVELGDASGSTASATRCCR